MVFVNVLPTTPPRSGLSIHRLTPPTHVLYTALPDAAEVQLLGAKCANNAALPLMQQANSQRIANHAIDSWLAAVDLEYICAKI